MSKQEKKHAVMALHMTYYMNNPAFVEGLKKEYPNAFNAVLETMKENKPEKCIMCEAFFWDAERHGPGCSIGGEITIFDTAKKCPLEE